MLRIKWSDSIFCKVHFSILCTQLLKHSPVQGDVGFHILLSPISKHPTVVLQVKVISLSIQYILCIHRIEQRSTQSLVLAHSLLCTLILAFCVVKHSLDSGHSIKRQPGLYKLVYFRFREHGAESFSVKLNLISILAYHILSCTANLLAHILNLLSTFLCLLLIFRPIQYPVRKFLHGSFRLPVLIHLRTNHIALLVISGNRSCLAVTVILRSLKQHTLIVIVNRDNLPIALSGNSLHLTP